LVERCALLEDMAAGLAHMHAMGYIHRDVKPHNVLLAWAQVRAPVHGLIWASLNAPLTALSSTR